MALTRKPVPSLPRRVQAILLTGVLGLLPLGIAGAQEPDWDSIGKRMREAVTAGEITVEQARVMLRALRETQREEGENAEEHERAEEQRRAEAQAQDPRMERYRGAERELKAEVEAGRISQEDADTRLVALRRELWSNDGEEVRDETDPRTAYEGMKRRVDAAVESGRFTAEEGEQRLEAYRRRLGEQSRAQQAQDGRMERFVATHREMQAMVRSGQVAQQDVDRRLAEMAQVLWGGAGEREAHAEDQDRRTRRSRYRAYEAELDAAVAAGELTREQADEKLAEVRRRMGADEGESGKKEDGTERKKEERREGDPIRRGGDR